MSMLRLMVIIERRLDISVRKVGFVNIVTFFRGIYEVD